MIQLENCVASINKISVFIHFCGKTVFSIDIVDYYAFVTDVNYISYCPSYQFCKMQPWLCVLKSTGTYITSSTKILQK